MDVNSVSVPFRYPGDLVYVERALDLREARRDYWLMLKQPFDPVLLDVYRRRYSETLSAVRAVEDRK